MRKMTKMSTALIAGFAALTMSAGASFAESPDRGGRGDRGERRVHVEKSQAPREARPVDHKVDVEHKTDRRRGEGNWHRNRIIRGHRYNWGPGFAFYFSDGYYYGECGWLKRRAIQSGNPIWWRRYHRCREFS